MLDGGEGHNLIAFGRESGNDMLVAPPNASNTIVLGADVRPDDVVVSIQNGYELTMSIRGSTATLRMPLMQDFQNGTPVQRTFADLRFADGTVWDEAQLLRQAYTGDDERNQIYGSQGDDWIDGRGGDDILEGRMGNDHIDGGAGNDFLRGDEGDDVLRGGQGNDILDGGPGANTYRFANGDGHDIVVLRPGPTTASRRKRSPSTPSIAAKPT
ncbi:hypothetical protein LP419_11475 [Massilia sp. H-1]|nr:hypothetical protein LP419_11475 [Massilia sp. H-1]